MPHPASHRLALTLAASALLAIASVVVHVSGGFVSMPFPPDEPLPRIAVRVDPAAPSAMTAPVAARPAITPVAPRD